MRGRGRVTEVVALAALVGGCARREHARAAPEPPPVAPAPARDAGAPADGPTPGAEHISVYDGRSHVAVEWVDADELRVKRLRAISVEANEIRCPRIERTRFPPTRKEEGWLRAEGDLVEIDEVEAHHVRARLVVADEIEAVAVKRVAKPHRWAGAGAGPRVRNRVLRIDPSTGLEDKSDGLATPVF
jgi:hypothetical protein